ncbi:malate:quinone oxidoreductase [Candidatus Carsonella ruddii]|uniref:malate:quinone oxidoreductase n=1 Tax=Carsonella ruddii TaxID=114186 RepID=UPI001B3C72D0|nr:malate:quinone oxidoreductase [Candidatus Carsonella ruddii]
MFNIISIIGAGVVSAITSLMLNLINQKLKIFIFEINKNVALENSKATNNAGTGHEGMCENNYVKLLNNEYYIKKNINIYLKFNLTKNFFSWIKILKIFNFKKVISKTPHVSFFFFKKNKKLIKIFKKIRIFNKSIKFTNNNFFFNKFSSLIIKKKKLKKKFSITYYRYGFDINYQYLSLKIFNYLTKKKKINLFLSCKIIKIKNYKNNFILTLIKNKIYKILSNYVFICAGGSSLTLLKNFNKKISRNYFELPINGTWLISEEKHIIKKHNLKIYSETIKGNPPMSIPHLDIRTIFNEKKIFFGPFAGLTFKVLINTKKNIIESINLKHFINLIFFSFKNKSIITYLINENLKTKKKKFFDIFPFCKIIKNTYCKIAGKRLQILKKKNKKLKLNFGTKLIFNKNKKFSTLLGASPGASISVNIAKNLIKKWFIFPKKFLFNYKKTNKKYKIFNSLLYLKGIEPFTI